LAINQPVKKSWFQIEWIFSVVTTGAVLILLGAIYLAYPGNFFDDISSFAGNFAITQVSSTISLPAPTNPEAYINLYRAAFELCLGVGIIEAVILMLRIMFRAPLKKIAENVGGLVSWFGSAYLTSVYLISAPSVTNWFVFWAAIFIVMGLSLIARAIVILGYKWKRRRR
jgi:hypothetical protein